LQKIEEERNKRNSKSTKSSKSKRTVFFSKLPLSLKKQFLYYLTKHEVDFSKNEDGRFMEALVEIQGEHLTKKQLKKKNKEKIEDFLERNGLVKKNFSKDQNQKNHKKKCYHKKCKMDEFDLHRDKEKRNRSKSKEKNCEEDFLK
jgi:hypothetical protein